MKRIEILGEYVELDVEGMAKGLHDMHASDPGMKAVLAFGMLDAGLCDLMEKMLRERILTKFSDAVKMIFPDRVEDFIKECAKEITTGVYKYAEMVV